MRDFATDDGILLHFDDEQVLLVDDNEVTLDDVNVDLIINRSKKAMKTHMRRSFRLSELCVLGLMLDLGVSCYKFLYKS